jgi:MOSC domain-containing protein YiiM
MIDLPLGTLYAGAPAPLGATGAVSAIVKTPVPPPWRIAAEGLVGDAQANRRHHGGPEKALHHYPREHYAAWIAEDASLAGTLGKTLADPAAFGENIATVGATEQTVCVGDVFTLGAARLQVSQGRQPCLTLNLRFGRRDMASRVQETGRTG